MNLQTLDVLTLYRFDEDKELPKGISDPDSGVVGCLCLPG